MGTFKRSKIAKKDKKGVIITHGYYPGHLTKARKIWNSLSHNKKIVTEQVDSKLAARINNPRPLQNSEIVQAKEKGLKVVGGYVVHD